MPRAARLAILLLAAGLVQAPVHAWAGAGPQALPQAPGRLAPAPVAPASTPWPVRQGDYVVRDFRFADGETLPELRLHYRTLGEPRRDAQGRVVNAVMVLHGTGGTGAQFLSPQFADVLYRPGGLLDIRRWYVILPDGIGTGGSSKPSDGLHARFPRYAYADMVEAQHRLLVDGLKVDGLRLLMGTSMGCMHSFMWAERWPRFAQAVMPLACLPVQIAGRNRMWRRALIDAVRDDPAWMGGDYAREPEAALRTASDLLLLAGSAPLQMQASAPTRDAADAAVEAYTARTLRTTDANDLLFQVEASRDYDPSAGLERITAPLTWINSADDFINPPELGVAEREAKRIRSGRFVLIPASLQTHGHGTHTWAAVWASELSQLLARS
jgi:homoserine O-acetyltransferase/O-succinyltransferase